MRQTPEPGMCNCATDSLPRESTLTVPAQREAPSGTGVMGERDLGALRSRIQVLMEGVGQ